MDIDHDGGRRGGMRLLLASSSLTALLIGSGTVFAPSAYAAACAINDVSNGAGAGPFNNTTNPINCINIQNSTVNGGTGNVSNSAPGVITTTASAANAAIQINNSTLTGSVVNAATITATTGSGGAFGTGISVINNASITGGITNSGTITATNGIEDGVEGFGISFSGGISNSGTIVGVGLFNAGVSVTDVSTFAGGISNSGTVSAQLGLSIGNFSTFSGGITNSGTIVGTAVSAGQPVGVFVAGTGNVIPPITANPTFTGAISNTGTITGGIGIEDFATYAGGNIHNSGTINGTQDGIVVTQISTFNASIINSSTISVGHVGMLVGGVIGAGSLTGITISSGVSNFAGIVSNFGVITAKTGIAIVGATVNGQIINNGNVLASTRGLLIDGASKIVSTATAVTFTGPSFIGGVSNAGTITTTGATGIEVNSVTTFGGGVINVGSIKGHTHAVTVAASSTFSGGITNSGTMSANNAVVFVSNVTVFGSNATGGITNNGTIAGGTAQGIFVTGVHAFNGGVANSGSIAAVRTGISLQGVTSFAGGITNSAGGTISAGLRGINLEGVATFTGNVSNAGTISAADGIRVGLSLATRLQGAIVDSGNILATGRGIVVGGAGEVSAATGAAIAVTGATLTGGVSNAGNVFAALGSGIEVAGVTTYSGGITNSGAVTAGNAGIRLNGVSAFIGNIASSGTITAATGINIAGSTIAGQIIVNGKLLATSEGIAIDSASRVSSTLTAVKVVAGPTFTGGITNAGVLSSPLHAGIDVLGVISFVGSVSNSGTITAKTGIAIGSDTVLVGGDVINSGNITATAAAIDTSAANHAMTIAQTGGTLNGAVKLSPNADVLIISGGAINGNIVGAGTSDTIDFVVGAGTFTYNNTISGVPTVDINTGTVVFNGSMTGASTVNVGSGATPAGTGTIDPLAVTIASGGKLAPGPVGGIGTLSIVGNLVFQSGATYAGTLNPTTASLTTVTGTATLAGIAQATFLPGNYVSKQYKLLSATGGVTGTFSGLTSFSLPVGASDTLSYDADDVYLNLTLSFGGYSALNWNQRNVANTLTNFMNSTGAIPTQFVSFTSSGLSQIDGEAATGAETSAFQLSDQFLQVLLDHAIGSGGGLAMGAADGRGPALAFAPQAQTAQASDAANALPMSDHRRWSIWAAAYGGSSNAQGDGGTGSSNLSAQTYGYVVGADFRLAPDATAGFALAGGGANWGLASGEGGGQSQALQFGGYGIKDFGPAYISGAVSFANNWFTTNRSALGDQLEAGFAGQSYGARAESGYHLTPVPNLGVTPFAALQFQDFETPSYRETDRSGGGFGLAYAAKSATETRSELGARVDSATMLDGKKLTLFGRLAWGHDFAEAPQMNAAFEILPGTSFKVAGAPIPHDSALTTVGLNYALSPDWQLSAKFDGSFAPGAQTYAGTGTVKYTW